MFRLGRAPAADRPGPSDALAMALGAYDSAIRLRIDFDGSRKVTGPKADVWTVNSVGAVVAVAGGALGQASFRGWVIPELGGLAVGSTLSPTGVDVYDVARSRMTPSYLTAALADLAPAGVWALARGRRPGEPLVASPNRRRPRAIGGGA